MKVNEFQEACLRTAPRIDDFEKAVSYAALKVASEGGEVAGAVGKWIGQGKELVVEEIVEECGDVVWHVAHLLLVLGVSLEECLVKNQEKLKERYPNGNEG